MTLICNLFGGPGTGKSTVAAAVFAKLKQQKVEADCIQEYAKDKTWQSEAHMLQLQPYISSKQLLRQHRILGKVDVGISDAPLLHGLIYPGHYTGEHFEKWLVETFNQFNNLNIFLERNVEEHGYSQVGRSQSLEQAVMIDTRTLEILRKHEIAYHTVKVTSDAADQVVNLVHGSLVAMGRLSLR